MKMISHPATTSHREKPLDLHLSNVASTAQAYIQRLSLCLTLIDKEKLSSLAFKVGLMHDLGKATSYFQAYIRGGTRSNLTHHSYISAVITYLNVKSDSKLMAYAPLAFKAVQKHHSHLNAFFNDRLDSNALIDETLTIYKDICLQVHNYGPIKALLKTQDISLPPLDWRGLKAIAKEIDNYEPAYNLDDSIELFLLQNLLFSVLIDADKHDAAALDEADPDALIQSMNYSPQAAVSANLYEESEINQIRTAFLKHIQDSTEIIPATKLYSMSAPTGSGKTYACLAYADNLQHKLQSKRRLIYCLPYTSIIDQNYTEFENVLSLNKAIPETDKYRYLLKHHHLVDYYKLSGDNPNYEFIDYLNDNLIAESWNSACIVSTFVQLFHSLVGNRNSMVRKLHNILNSIIILDEVQSLPAKFYPLIRSVFSVLAERFDTYILTCTATQPFIYEHGSFTELCTNINFHARTFNRVKLHISSEVHTIETFCSTVLDLSGTSNALFVMNTKRAAITIYEAINSKFGAAYEVLCLTTLHSPIDRQATIKYVKQSLANGKPIILVSTQLIEAGVDLSFCRVYRDFGPLDSIIQVAGRCNRNGELGELGGIMYLISLSDERGEYSQKVYDKYILSKTRECLKNHSEMCSLQFADLIYYYYSSLDIGAVGNAILKAIRSLNYDQDINNQVPIKNFLLIEDQYATETVYILSDSIAEDALNTIIECRYLLKNPSLTQTSISQAQLSMRRAYHVLSHYQINLTIAETANYNDGMLYYNKLTDHVHYISQNHLNKAYNANTGFILNPDDTGGCLAL